MRPLCAFALLAGLVTVAPARAAETATAAVMVQVDVCSRTSLRVSSDLLRFTVLVDAAPATAGVDVSAAGRIPPGADLVLTVEPLPADSSAQIGGSVALGAGPALAAHEPAVAARWRGSGLRAGRLVFTLSGAQPGTHDLPVRFVLSTP